MNIYMLVNKATAKRYIGMSSANAARIRHRYGTDAKRFGPTEQEGRLLGDIYLHGIQHVSVILIDTCEDGEADLRRRYWIEHLGTAGPRGYNQREAEHEATDA